MSHPLLKAAIPCFFVSILLSLPAQKLLCFCRTSPNVLEAYDAADEVLIVRVLSSETVEETDYSRLTTGRVERVYKGSSKLNDQLVFGENKHLKCLFALDKESIGKQFLFYLKRSEKTEDRWHVFTCSRSNDVEYAREDLLYLDNEEKLRGKTRVSGIYIGTHYPLLNAANRKIRIIGNKKTYEVNTDASGVYEIYDLPPGKYRVETEIPTGWKLYGFHPRSSTFVLEPNKHVNVNMVFLLDNTIEGTIVGPNGNPLPALCAHLWIPDQNPGKMATACANEKGRFRFESVLPGTYLLVVNPSPGPASELSSPQLYYPGTEQREKAVLINISAGEKLRNLKLVVPATSHR